MVTWGEAHAWQRENKQWANPLLGIRDIAGATCERHPRDWRRESSLALFPPFIRCRADQNQVVLNAVFAKAADCAWSLW